MTLKEKMFEIQKLHLKFPKTTEGYNYKYVPLDEMWEKLVAVLDERNLLVVHQTVNKEVQTKVIDTESDEFEVSSMPLPENLDPQKLGSAITYYRRYNLMQLFNLMAEDDDDGASTKPKAITGGVVRGGATQKQDDNIEDIIG